MTGTRPADKPGTNCGQPDDCPATPVLVIPPQTPLVPWPVIGATIAVAIIGAVRGLPDKEEREAAQGGALPMSGAPAPDGHGEGTQAPAG